MATAQAGCDVDLRGSCPVIFTMQIAITGADGQLGRELCRQLGPQADGLSRQRLDVTDPSQIGRVLDDLRPTAVINTAGYTLVDKAEQEPDLCGRSNALAVKYLAEACQARGTMLVQISTDYVFGGDGGADRSPYRESDPPAPQSVYAATKLAGEESARLAPRHLIVRTCGLYGLTAKRHNFVETMLRLAGDGRRIRVVNDQHCTPSSVCDVARGILDLIQREAHGIYHIVNGGQTTWYDFAQEIFCQSGLNVSLEPITSEQYGAPARRPAYSVLSTDKYHALGGPPMPAWPDALAEYLRERAGAASA